MIIIWLLLLVFIFCVYKIISIHPPRGKHTWECGYCDFRGPAYEVIKHAHECHQAIFDKEDLID